MVTRCLQLLVLVTGLILDTLNSFITEGVNLSIKSSLREFIG